MRILLISNMYPAKHSFFGIFIKQQVAELEDTGIKIIKVTRTKDSSLAYIPFLLKSFFYLLFYSYDLVHSHYGFHSALFPALFKRRPLIITFHGSDALEEPFRNIIYFYLQKFVTLRADHVIAVSREIKYRLISSLNTNPAKISIISCGVNTSLFVPLNKIEMRKRLKIDEKVSLVLFAGAVCYMKGVDLLYKCAQRMIDVLFVFVGNGSFKSGIENCMFVGPCPHDQMPVWMNAADIFVLPSRSEGTPLVILEALSSSLPVICSRVGGCPDIIREGENGILIPVNDADELQEKIDYLLGNTALRISMGKKGRKGMIDAYDNRIIAERIKGLYKTITEKKGKEPICGSL